jgi:hypothetical protein
MPQRSLRGVDGRQDIVGARLLLLRQAQEPSIFERGHIHHCLHTITRQQDCPKSRHHDCQLWRHSGGQGCCTTTGPWQQDRGLPSTMFAGTSCQDNIKTTPLQRLLTRMPPSQLTQRLDRPSMLAETGGPQKTPVQEWQNRLLDVRRQKAS